jgi:hypothetical protein
MIRLIFAVLFSIAALATGIHGHDTISAGALIAAGLCMSGVRE